MRNRMTNWRPGRLGLISGVCFMAACGGDDDPVVPPPPPPDEPPTARSVPNQMIWMGHAVQLDLTSYFADPEGDALTFAAESSDEGVLTASVTGNLAELNGVSEGSVDVMLRATDPRGQSAVIGFQATTEYGDSLRFAAPISVGDTVAIVSSRRSDDEYFVFTVPTEGYRLAMYTEGELDIRGYLFTSVGDGDPYIVAIDNTSGEDRNFRIELQLSSAHPYYLRTRPTADGTYTLILAEGGESDDDHGDIRSTASTLTLGERMEGVLAGSGDVDVFEFETTSNPFRLAAVSEGRTDTFGYLWDADGNLLMANDDAPRNVNFRLSTDLVLDGTYYIGVRGFGGTEGPYAVLVEEREADDHGDAAATATPVSIGDTLRASLVALDRDYFSIEITTDSFPFRAYSVGRHDTRGFLFNSDGDLLFFSDDHGERSNFDIRHRLAAAGTYYVMVDGFGGRPGDYTLILAQADDLDADELHGRPEDDLGKEVPAASGKVVGDLEAEAVVPKVSRVRRPIRVPG